MWGGGAMGGVHPAEDGSQSDSFVNTVTYLHVR
jgi:hypothetical protein